MEEVCDLAKKLKEGLQNIANRLSAKQQVSILHQNLEPYALTTTSYATVMGLA